MEKWKIIRNEKNEIIRYQLTENIYIDREYSKDFTTNKFYNTLMVNNEFIGTTGNGSGYTLRDLKKKGEGYYNKNDK